MHYFIVQQLFYLLVPSMQIMPPLFVLNPIPFAGYQLSDVPLKTVVSSTILSFPCWLSPKTIYSIEPPIVYNNSALYLPGAHVFLPRVDGAKNLMFEARLYDLLVDLHVRFGLKYIIAVFAAFIEYFLSFILLEISIIEVKLTFDEEPAIIIVATVSFPPIICCILMNYCSLISWLIFLRDVIDRQ